MELYVIRHGETLWNEAGRLQGSVDIELNETGRELAGKLGRELEDVAFDRIYSSPLIRAYETACLIRGHRNIPIIREERLREISFGDLEGIHYSEWMKEDSPYHYFFTEPEKYNPPVHGESLEQVCTRTKEFMQEVMEPLYAENERIMIVAHGAVNKGLMCYMEGNDKAHYWGEGLQNNCEASIFSFDGNHWSKRKPDRKKLQNRRKNRILKR